LKVERTSIPTLIPATLPAADRFVKAPVVVKVTPSVTGGTEIARPSNPGGPGPAVDLTGNAVAGKLVFENNCSVCHMPAGVGGHPNPGSDDGTVPTLNPIDETQTIKRLQPISIYLLSMVPHRQEPVRSSKCPLGAIIK
jgi:hypothetical protein